MNILIISETLTAGGAEWFALRLANAFVQAKHKVAFFVLRPDIIHTGLTEKFPAISIRSLPVWLIKILALGDRLIKKINGQNDVLITFFNSLFIRQYLKKHPVDVIHGHLIKSDAAGIMARGKRKIRQVTTVHGDYIKAIKNQDSAILETIYHVIPELDRIVIISKEQAQLLSRDFPQASTKLKTIYNGYPVPYRTLTEKNRETFNFGLIARGIPEKGWEPAIRAFLMFPDENIRLWLYAAGDHITMLQQQYTDPRIIFAGFTDRPLEAIHQFDVGLLPSYYPSESLPTTVIEYLLMEKPVIATCVGAISDMLQPDNGSQAAGLLIKTTDPEQMIQPLYEAMYTLLHDKTKYTALQHACMPAFQKFSMDHCVAAYLSVYKGES